MATSRIKTSSILQGFPKSRSLLAGNAGYDPAATWLIQRQTLTSTAATVTFSSIPSTYKHLQLRYLAQHNSGIVDYWDVRLTVNTSTSYAYHLLQGSGAAASAAGSSSQSTANTSTLIPSGTANTFGVGLLDFVDYASTTKNKTVRCFGGFDRNGSGFITLSSILSINTAAINSITLSASNFNTGSTFALYGMVG